MTDILAPCVFIFTFGSDLTGSHCAITTEARRRGLCHYGARLSAVQQLLLDDLRGERAAGGGQPSQK